VRKFKVTPPQNTEAPKPTESEAPVQKATEEPVQVKVPEATIKQYSKEIEKSIK